MFNPCKSFFYALATAMLATGCVTDAKKEKQANKVVYKANLNPDAVDGWRISKGTKIIAAGKHAKSSLRVSSGKKTASIASPELNIPVSSNTFIEFEWKCDSKKPLRYIAFAANIKGCKKSFWLWGGRANAISKPERGKWHKLRIPLTDFRTADKATTIKASDILARLVFHQIQETGVPHSFAIDNLRIVESCSKEPKSDMAAWRENVSASETLIQTKRDSKSKLPLITATPAGTPVLDGKLDDPCWEKASGVSMLPNNIRGKITEDTRFLICYDDKYIYIGIDASQSCLDPVMNLLNLVKAKAAKRDGDVYMDDSVEIFLDTGKETYYQFALNSIGTLYDAKNAPGNFNSKWNSSAKVAAVRGLKNWTAELAVPLKDLNSGQKLEGKRWLANFYRTNTAKNESGAWSPTGKSYHNMLRFGTLAFSKNVPAMRCDKITQTTTKTAIKLEGGGKKTVLIKGAGKTVDIPANTWGKLNLPIKPDTENFGQITAMATGKEIFRSPLLLAKAESTEINANIKCPGGNIELFLNGKKIASGTGSVSSVIKCEDEKNLVAIKLTGKRANGTFSMPGLVVDLKDFLFSETPQKGWETDSFEDKNWKLYKNKDKKNKTVCMRHLFVKGHSNFAPKLNNNTMFLANGAPLQLHIPFSSPIDKPLKDFKQTLIVPDGIKIPLYEPLQRRACHENKMEKTEMSENRASYSFAYKKSVKKNKSSSWFETHLFASPEFATKDENKLFKGYMYVSGRGMHEIPRKFLIKILPKLRGKQPQKIYLPMWLCGLNSYGTSKEFSEWFKTFKEMGVNVAGIRINFKNPDYSKVLNEHKELAKLAKKYNLKTELTIYGNLDPHFLRFFYKQFPSKRLINHGHKQAAYKKSMCPLFFMSNPKVSEQLKAFSKIHDRIDHDLESGIDHSCSCENCRKQFAKEIGLKDTPSGKEVFTKYKKQWAQHQVKVNYDIFMFLRKTAKSVNSNIKTSIYSAHSIDSIHEKYGMEWSLYKDVVDMPQAGYTEKDEVIQDTRKSLANKSIAVGLILHSNGQEYDNQKIKARLFQQLVSGGFGGIIFWWFGELNGIGMTEYAEFSRGISAYENMLNEKFEIPSKGLVSGISLENIHIYKNGGKYLYMLINRSAKEKKLTIKMPKEIKNPISLDFYSNKKYTGKKEFNLTLAPKDTLLLDITEASN